MIESGLAGTAPAGVAVLRQGAHGRHSYSPEKFGLDGAQLRKDFAAYIERFKVRLED